MGGEETKQTNKSEREWHYIKIKVQFMRKIICFTVLLAWSKSPLSRISVTKLKGQKIEEGYVCSLCVFKIRERMIIN